MSVLEPADMARMLAEGIECSECPSPAIRWSGDYPFCGECLETAALDAAVDYGDLCDAVHAFLTAWDADVNTNILRSSPALVQAVMALREAVGR